MESVCKVESGVGGDESVSVHFLYLQTPGQARVADSQTQTGCRAQGSWGHLPPPSAALALPDVSACGRARARAERPDEIPGRQLCEIETTLWPPPPEPRISNTG